MTIQDSYKNQKLALYWLLGTIYSGFISLQLGNIQAIADFNYNLHEILFVPFTIAVFLAPVLLLVYIYLLIKYLRKRGRKKPSIKTMTKAVLIILSLVLIVSVTVNQSLEVSTYGVFEVDQKLQEDGKYYVYIDDKKVRVASNEFQLIEVNRQYAINFVWNKRTPNKGRLQSIEPIRPE